MRICRSCGRENPDESDFCTCGEYLRWEPTNFMPSVAAPEADAAQSNGVAAPAEAAAGGAAAATPRPTGPASGHPMSPQDLDPNVTLGPEMILPAGRAGGSGAGWTRRGAPTRGGGAVAAPARRRRRRRGSGLRVGRTGRAGHHPRAHPQPVRRGRQLRPLGAGPARRLVDDDAGDRLPRALRQRRHLRAGDRRSTCTRRARRRPRRARGRSRWWRSRARTAARWPPRRPASRSSPTSSSAPSCVPSERSGRLKARYVLTVCNKANARTEVDLAAEDTDGECDFRFAEPRIALEPGNGIECPFTVFPPKQKWIGRAVDRQFQVTATPIGTEAPVPPRMATFRQRPWLPWWMAIVGPIAGRRRSRGDHAAAQADGGPEPQGPAQRVRRPEAAEQDRAQAGDDHDHGRSQAEAGSVADQSPAAGTKAKKGTVVDVVVVTGTGKATVPAIVGLPLGLAEQTLIAAGLTLGAVQPQPPNPNGKISSQMPLAGTQVAEGFAVAVFLAAPGGGQPRRARLLRPPLPLPPRRRRRRRRERRRRQRAPRASPPSRRRRARARSRFRRSPTTRPRPRRPSQTPASSRSRSSDWRPSRSDRSPAPSRRREPRCRREPRSTC